MTRMNAILLGCLMQDIRIRYSFFLQCLAAIRGKELEEEYGTEDEVQG